MSREKASEQRGDVGHALPPLAGRKVVLEIQVARRGLGHTRRGILREHRPPQVRVGDDPRGVDHPARRVPEQRGGLSLDCLRQFLRARSVAPSLSGEEFLAGLLDLFAEKRGDQTPAEPADQGRKRRILEQTPHGGEGPDRGVFAHPL